MYKRVLALAFAALAIAALAAGCGGGGDSSSSAGTESEGSGGPAPTKAAFIKEADKICGDADEAMTGEITEYAEENGIEIEKEEPSEDQQTEILQAVVLHIAKQGEDIAALTPPEGDEGTIEELTDSLASGVEEAEDDPQAATDPNGPLEDASKEAKAYGLKTCGQ